MRLQRRLSDPSANIAKFARGGWRTRDRAADKSRSENEGLDSLVDGITEVEAGDLRDGRYPRGDAFGVRPSRSAEGRARRKPRSE